MSAEATRQDATPPYATELFGDGLAEAERFAELLSTEGAVRGLIGPREVPRIWQRHLVNSAVVADLLPPDPVRVVDVGSGAGLPGIPLAIRLGDLRVDLVEPALRRTSFLTEVVAELGLHDRVRVLRGRAEDPVIRTVAGGADWVVARAVAPLDRLARWCVPLLSAGGTLLALKGVSAEDEVAEHRTSIERAGATVLSVESVGDERIGRARVVVIRRRSGTR